MKVLPGRMWLAKYSSTSPRILAAGAAEADFEEGGFGDGADVHAGLAGGAFVADVDLALGVAEEFSVAVIAGERVAAVFYEFQGVVEVLGGEGGVGGGAADFGEHFVGVVGGGGGG